MHKTWGELSGTYRGRLERGGISQREYESGRSLAAARGHARTPERPERAMTSPGRYKDYLDRRTSLERDVIAKKRELFESSPRFNAKRSARAIHEGPKTGKPAKMAAMQRFMDADFDELYDEIVADDNEWDFLFYH